MMLNKCIIQWYQFNDFESMLLQKLATKTIITFLMFDRKDFILHNNFCRDQRLGSGTLPHSKVEQCYKYKSK